MFKPFSLNISGKLAVFDRPAVMAIVNATPDSFYAGSRAACTAEVCRRTERMISDGADIIDAGACSTRPGSDSVSATEETDRLAMALRAIRSVNPDIPVSVDTFRADVARRCIEEFGANIINDISDGTLDPMMYETVASLKVPYVMMHTRGTPETMQSLSDYSADGGVMAALLRFFAEKISLLTDMGVNDIIIDPGFGFAKTLEQNWEIMRELESFTVFHRPVLAGISRKSMLTKLLGITAEEALPATAMAGMLALQGGASILRVHDPAPARQAITILSAMQPDLTDR